MREITTKVYKYEELNDEAKEKARNWYREGDDRSHVWEDTKEDAKNIGLQIFSLDDHRANSGKFVDSARECAEEIINNHGEACETYKTAKAFLAERDEIVNTAEKDADGSFKDEYALDEALDKCEEEFLDSILEDYRILYNKDMEYHEEDEQVADNIIANEYEFTEGGEIV